MIAVNLTAFTNPLSTEIGVFRHSGVFAPGISVGEVKRAFGYELPLVMVNGQIVDESVQMHQDFSLVIATEAHGGAFKQILVAAAIGALTGGLGFALGYSSATSLSSAIIGGAITGAITAGVGIVVSKLIGSPSAAQQVSRDDIPAYGLSGVSNSARGLGPVNWSFGRTLVAPPLDARQWTHAVDDGVNVVTETFNELVTERSQGVSWDGSAWVLTGQDAFPPYSNTVWTLVSGTIWSLTRQYVTGALNNAQDPNSNTGGTMFYDTTNGSYQAPGSTIWQNYGDAHPKLTYVKTGTTSG